MENCTHKVKIGVVEEKEDIKVIKQWHGLSKVSKVLKGKTFWEVSHICQRLTHSEQKDKESKIIEDHVKLMGEGVSNVPNIKWSDVGGLTHAKHDILQTIQLP